MAQFLDYNGLGHFKDKNDALYAKQDGSYEGMTVGNAEQLVSTVGVEDSAPYTFRTTGGSADVGDRLNLKAVVGGTVAWNQLAALDATKWSKSYASVTFNGRKTIITATDSGSSRIKTVRFAIIPNHKHLVLGTFIGADSNLEHSGISIGIYSSSNNNTYSVRENIAKGTNTDTSINNVWDSGANGNYFGLTFPTAGTTAEYAAFDNLQLYDLTQMFGPTIADYIYALEQSNAGAGVAYFRKLFPKSYYAYNAANLQSVETSAHKTVGFNAYDHSAGKAKVLGGMVYQITGAYTALSLDGTSITPDANGYFTPSANGELTVTGGNSTTTCIHLKWDGERDGEYEPYEEHTYDLDDVELRGILKLDASNNLYYDGDEYAPDGTVTRKYAIRAYTSGDATDGSTMITDGTNTVYKLTTPTTESADAYTELQVCDDFGTEEFTDAATRDFDMPCGSLAVYRPNLRAKLEMSPNSPSDGDGLYVVQQISGENTYVPLVVPTELPSVSDTDEGKVLAVNNSGVWVAQNPIGKPFVVTLTPTSPDYSGTMDKTVAEINAAYEAGREIWFVVITSASTSVKIPLTYWATDTSYDYNGFAANLVNVASNMMIVAYVGGTSDGTTQTYGTKLYTLTPAT